MPRRLKRELVWGQAALLRRRRIAAEVHDQVDRGVARVGVEFDAGFGTERDETEVVAHKLEGVGGVVDGAGRHAPMGLKCLLLGFIQARPAEGLEVVLRAGRDGEAV